VLKNSQQLIELARETSGERRRELLHRLSDLFIAAEKGAGPVAPAQMREDFARIAEVLLDQLDVEVRREFAERFADQPDAPAQVMAKLAHDVIEVARPVLRRSEAVEEADLVAVALMRSQDHLRALSGRTQVSEDVADAVVQRGDDETLVTLARNLGARFSREAFERLADRSERVAALREPLVERADTPLDLAHEMLVFVEQALRARILARVRNAPPQEVEAAIRAARERAERRRVVSPDEAKILREVRDLKARGRLTKAAVIERLRNGEETWFLAGLAELLDLTYDLARRLCAAEALDPLAIAIRASGGDRAFFVSIALEREGAGVRKPELAKAFGDSFEAIPVESAKRVMRFWRVRRDVPPSEAQA
jgi:uncharacterized protein (DUF2336 family)